MKFMKYNIEHYICDRCGSDIYNSPENVTSMPSRRHFIIKTTELGKYEYVSGIEHISPENLAIDIVEFFGKNYKEYNLCRKCRKDFKRFMKNEN